MKREEAIMRLKQNRAAAAFYAEVSNKIKTIKNELLDIEAIDMAIEALSTEDEWIPASERLPDKPKDVLTTLSNGMVCIGRYHSFDKWTFEAASIMVAFPEETVIAWMPLPEPYREDGEAE